MRRPPTLPSILLLALASMGATRSAEAQDLRYTTTTKMELAGAMGAMASMMPGMGDAVEQTTYMKGSLVRTDDGTTSGIMDWATGDIVQLDHAARTYTRFNFKEMASAVADAMGEALAAEEEGMGSAAAGAVAGEVSSALSRLGRFGRKQEEPEEAPPAQMSLMRATTEITNVTTTSLDDALFQVPDGYTERVMEMPVRR